MRDIDSTQQIVSGRIGKKGMEKYLLHFLGGLLAMAVVTGTGLSGAAAADQNMTPEQIMKNDPELYRKIQDGPRLPPPEVDPVKPYDPYPGFFAQPVLKPGQNDEWWENSSYDYSPVYPYLLKHTHFKFNFARSSGNDDGHVWNGAILMALRKDRITDTIAYSIEQKHVYSADGSFIDKDTQNFENTLSYEFNRYLLAETGYIWQRMSIFMIKDRNIPFVGIGSYNILQDVLNKKTDHLGLRLALARVMDDYYATVSDVIHKDSDSFNGVYLKADYSHKFGDLFTYKQEFTVKQALDATNVYGLTTIPGASQQMAITLGTTKRYDWNWSNSLEFALNQYVGFLLSYDVAYDSNPWPIARKRDTEFMTGFKFAF